MDLDQKLDEALKGTFPASDPFYLPPERAAPRARAPRAVDADQTARCADAQSGSVKFRIPKERA